MATLSLQWRGIDENDISNLTLSKPAISLCLEACGSFFSQAPSGLSRPSPKVLSKSSQSNDFPSGFDLSASTNSAKFAAVKWPILVLHGSEKWCNQAQQVTTNLIDSYGI
jgi:hypothetical protein